MSLLNFFIVLFLLVAKVGAANPLRHIKTKHVLPCSTLSPPLPWPPLAAAYHRRGRWWSVMNQRESSLLCSSRHDRYTVAFEPNDNSPACCCV